jgi:hypothetical protein
MRAPIKEEVMAPTAQARVPDPQPEIDTRTERASDLGAIEAVLWTYLDGLHEGDADKLAAAFHPVSHLYSDDKGSVADLPRDHWLEWVRSRPSPQSKGLARHDRIVSIDQSGPATAFVKLECAVPPRFFVDYLTLLKTNEGWRIVAKAFKTETR